VHNVRDQVLLDLPHSDARAEDDRQIGAQRAHTAGDRAVPHGARDEGQIEEGRVRVDKLEEKHLHDHTVLELEM
jgi:hypothetical protein